MNSEATLDTPPSPADASAAPQGGGSGHTPAHSRAHAHASSPRAKPPARKSRWKPIAGLIVGVAILAWLSHVAFRAYYYEETEDAYVVGHLHQISPRIDGQVSEVLVGDNQVVKAGQPLVKLDPQEFQIAVDKADAALAQARAQETEARAELPQIDAQLAEARARVSQAKAQLAQTNAQLELARLTLNRNEQLFQKGGVITQADLDNVRSAFRAAEAAQAANRANQVAAQATVGSAEAARVSAEAKITAAQASVAAAETALRDARRSLSYTTVVAPAAGRVGNKAVEAGNHVVTGQTLMSLAAPENWIVANFKETQLAHMHAGQAVELTIDALPGLDLHGTIDSLAPASGAQFALLPPDNATGNFNKVVQRVPVKIVLDAASLRAVADRLRLGLSVVVSVRVR
jgi:membrane fusion protein (multidrug efflux system)